MDPDPDPGSQNLADPTDPDSKHCISEVWYTYLRKKLAKCIFVLLNCIVNPEMKLY